MGPIQHVTPNRNDPFPAQEPNLYKRCAHSTCRFILDSLGFVAELDDPHVRGKGLVADKSGLWWWRVGDYRVVSSIYEDVVVINVIDVGHRRNIYLQAHHFRMRKICSLNRSDIHQRHTMTAVAPAIWWDI